MRTAGQIRDEMARLGAVIASARHMVTNGHLIDLEPLAPRIGELCLAAQALPRDEARGLSDELLLLAGKLDGLGIDIRERLERLPAPDDVAAD